MLINALVPSVCHAAERSGPYTYSMPLLGGRCIEAEVRDYLCRLQEILMAEVVSEDRW